MTSIAKPYLRARMEAWDEAAWSLAALALAASENSPPELTAAARELLAAAAGLTGPASELLPGLGLSDAGQVASEAAATLHQASALVSGRGTSWSDQSDEALLAQGNASAQIAAGFARVLLPSMGDLSGRLAAPGARMLDIGTGVGALAVGFAEAFPQLAVLGIDVFDRALALARQTIADSGVDSRVALRRQDVAEFADHDGFDLVWLPAPFIPQPALAAGLPRVAAALRPGGWLVVAHGKYDGTLVQNALARLKTIAYGGTPLDGQEASRLLRDAGLTTVRPVPTPPGAPAITIGQKPV
jgi:SAM-dependent methyltransferase